MVYGETETFNIVRRLDTFSLNSSKGGVQCYEIACGGIGLMVSQHTPNTPTSKPDSEVHATRCQSKYILLISIFRAYLFFQQI